MTAGDSGRSAAHDLVRRLWPEGTDHGACRVYALLDGARDDDIAPAVWDGGLPYACLYAGELSPALRLAAPYLVQLTPTASLLTTLCALGWGNAWGIYVVAAADVSMAAVRKHLRSLLRVEDAHGRMLVFRFYDPRVLRVYMPACDRARLARMLGPLQALACEDEHGSALLRFAAPPGAVAAGTAPLAISAHQMDKLAQDCRRRGNERILAYVKARFPDTFSSGSPHAHLAIVDGYRERARAFGLVTDDQVGFFIDLSIMYGNGVADLPWCAPILRDPGLSGAARMEQLTRVLDDVGVYL